MCIDPQTVARLADRRRDGSASLSASKGQPHDPGLPQVRFRRSVCVSDGPRLEGQGVVQLSPSQAKLCPTPSAELKVRNEGRKMEDTVGIGLQEIATARTSVRALTGTRRTAGHHKPLIRARGAKWIAVQPANCCPARRLHSEKRAELQLYFPCI